MPAQSPTARPPRGPSSPLGLTPERLAEARLEAEQTARHFRLHWQGPTPQQVVGARLSAQPGSALELHDQREYQPGDDPRHLNWRAYARTEKLLMNVYQRESQPHLDLICDGSASMFTPEGKAYGTWRLWFFCQALAAQDGLELRCWLSQATGLLPWDGSPATWPQTSRPSTGCPDLTGLSARRGLRLLVTDLLYAAEPAHLLQPLKHGASQAWIICPWSESEWPRQIHGLTAFRASETGESRLWQAQPEFWDDLTARYNRHLELWQRAALTGRVGLARVEAEAPLCTALEAELRPAGLIAIR